MLYNHRPSVDGQYNCGKASTSALSRIFFKNVQIFILLEVYCYVVTKLDGVLNLVYNVNSATKIFDFFFHQPFSKGVFLKGVLHPWTLFLKTLCVFEVIVVLKLL